MYGVQKSSKLGSNQSGHNHHHQTLHSNKLSLNSNNGLFDSGCVKLATPTYAGVSSSSTIYENSISAKHDSRPSSISNEKSVLSSGIK